MTVVTAHAVKRYCERVEPVAAEKAMAILSAASSAIDVAARFGCPCVVLGNAARLMLKGDVVATVLEKRHGRRARI